MIETRFRGHGRKTIETRCRQSSLLAPPNLPQVQCRDCGLERVDNDDSLHLLSIVLLPSLYSFPDLIILYAGQPQVRNHFLQKGSKYIYIYIYKREKTKNRSTSAKLMIISSLEPVKLEVAPA